MRDFRHLRVWRSAFLFSVAIYKATRSFPQEERYGLAAQLRSAASSISANIAEGCGRSSAADFTRFLNIAMGSASEVASHLMLARALRLISREQYLALYEDCDHTKRMLGLLITRLRPQKPRKRHTGPENRSGADA